MHQRLRGKPLEGFAEFSMNVAAQGAVLLKNRPETLPLESLDRVAIFGRTQINYYRSGTGSGGAVNVIATCNLLEAMRERCGARVNGLLAQRYEQWVMTHPFDNGGGGWAQEPWHQQEMPLDDDVVAQAKRVSNKAVVVIGRTAGEDKDNADVPGGYRLTELEYAMLRTVCRYFSNVIVVLNVSSIMEMSWAEDPLLRPHLGAILYAWHGGPDGGRAVAALLCGEVTPSGKLTDTIARSLDDYPSSACWGNSEQNIYQEDIYVGYRYFETFCPQQVLYPFGFGLSYTRFAIHSLHAERMVDNPLFFQITAKVDNVGERFAGSEVVQIYLEAPQGALGKPTRALVAFAKTRILQPGESETLTLTVPLERLASWDDSGVTGNPHCWVLEPGLYRFWGGNCVNQLQAVRVQGEEGYTQPLLRVLSCHEQALAPTVSFSRLRPGKRAQPGVWQAEWEEVPRRKISLRERIHDRLPPALAITGDKGFKLVDVVDGRVSMEAFIAQLSAEELACLVRGEGMCSHKVTPGVASAFGGTGDSLLEKGIPLAATADGPSGIRMDNGAHATLMPSGTLLASTWDPVLVERLYVMEGKELQQNQIDLLLGPGMNIHRHPLNGRNFEYFSEDPLLTGMMAAAMVRGIRSGGGIATLKHFACNSQEHARAQADAVVSARALREIYLKGFEYAVKQGGAMAVMTAYNPVNGHWSASNYCLNTTILRDDWGFNGIVMTDWWAKMNDAIGGGEATVNNTAAMIRAQNDLYMVINNNGAEINAGNDNTLSALAEGSLTLGELQRSARNILSFMLHTQVVKRGEVPKVNVPTMAADASLYIEDAINIAPESRLRYSDTLAIHIEREGVYDLLVSVNSPAMPLAQTATNLLFNGKFVATVQTRGTMGKTVTQKLCRVQLLPGYYQVQTEEIKPGLAIDWLEFRRVASPESA